MLLSAQVRGDVAGARAVIVGRACAVSSARGDALVSGVFLPYPGACFKEVARLAVRVGTRKLLAL